MCFQKADQYEMQLGGLSTQTDSLTSLPNPKNEDMRKSTGATSNDEAPVSFSGGASTWPSVSTSKVTPDFADANPMPPSLTSGQDNTGDSKLCDTAPHQAAKQAGEISVSVETEKENKSVFVIHERPALEEILARIRTYERITTAQPSNHSAWDTLGKLYKSIERYQDALWAYHEALKWDSKNESYWYYLGLLYSIEQQPEDARLAFEQVLSLRPDHTLAHSALAGIYRRKGMEARANFHIAAAMKKIHLESAYNRACFYAICEERDTALEYLKQALEAGETTVRWVQVDPDLASLRSDQRYQQLLHRFEQRSSNVQTKNYFASNVQGSANPTLSFFNNALAGDTYGH
ncbi:MAG: tetratricopeptide repeat protein [Anaerolineales bacterium]|nr:tetratricopeptide repeat protein [Anaerolineales bacterium]MCX7609741.1 tetratricopeptide repeat protein [Anaerolineales bacterium]